MFEYSFKFDPCFLNALLDALNSLLSMYPRYDIREAEEVSFEEAMNHYLELERKIRERDHKKIERFLDQLQNNIG